MKLQDFWSYIDPAPANMCWEWGRSIGGPGYGVCWIDSKCHNAHKVAYELSHGLVVDGLVVRHTCHNRKCCNPAHLTAGTHQDNVDDMMRAGRNAVGERVGTSKITEDQARRIKEMAQYRTQQATADHFGLNQSQVSRIANGKRWAHL
jgi:hypothetical protein